MKIIDAVVLYLANKAPTTSATYLQVWDEWRNFNLNKPTLIKAADLQDASRYIAAMRCADNTKRKKLKILRTLYAVFLDLKLVKENPFAQAMRFLSARRQQQVRPTKKIAPKDVLRLLEVTPARAFHEIRDRAMLAVMFGCGLRRSEIQRLNIDDVRTDSDGIMFLRLRDTKAGIEQQQPIPPWVWEYVSAYISERYQQGSGDAEPLFAVHHGEEWKPMSCSNIYKLFVGYCQKLGLEPGTAPHAARATAATQLLQQGETYDSVQRFLRHNTPWMVATYDKRLKSLANNPGRKIDYN